MAHNQLRQSIDSHGLSPERDLHGVFHPALGANNGSSMGALIPLSTQNTVKSRPDLSSEFAEEVSKGINKTAFSPDRLPPRNSRQNMSSGFLNQPDTSALKKVQLQNMIDNSISSKDRKVGGSIQGRLGANYNYKLPFPQGTDDNLRGAPKQSHRSMS